MRLTEAAEPVFARHETFHPRYGWFRKAYRAVKEDPGIFDREDAPVRIGVGKNMVRAIRFWGLAAGLITESTAGRRRATGLVTTRFGDRLFGDSGWDPYMEAPGTLWLLHWRLLAAPCRLPVWWLAFHEFHALEFTDDDLEGAIASQLDAATDWKRPSRSSRKKDVSVLLRTYAPAEANGRGRADDRQDGPLRELGLIRRSPAPGHYRFVLGEKQPLPPAVATCAALEYAASTGAGGNTMALGRLVRDPGSPGRAFRLPETELLASTEPTVRRTKHLGLASSTGTTLFSWSRPPLEVASAAPEDYYRSGAR